MLSEYTLNFKPISLEDADGSVKPYLEGAKKQIGLVPNMFACMANAPALLKSYLDSYQTFREDSHFSPVEQEVLFLTISRWNGCEYCMAAHSVVADTASQVPTSVTDAIRNGEALNDDKLAALQAFAVAMLESRGAPSADEVGKFLRAGYSEQQILEVIVAIAVKTFSNYANHLMHTPLDEAFAGRVWKDEAFTR